MGFEKICRLAEDDTGFVAPLIALIARKQRTMMGFRKTLSTWLILPCSGTRRQGINAMSRVSARNLVVLPDFGRISARRGTGRRSGLPAQGFSAADPTKSAVAGKVFEIITLLPLPWLGIV